MCTFSIQKRSVVANIGDTFYRCKNNVCGIHMKNGIVEVKYDQKVDKSDRLLAVTAMQLFSYVCKRYFFGYRVLQLIGQGLE